MNQTVNRAQAPSPPTKPNTMKQKAAKVKREETEAGKVLQVCYECNSVMVFFANQRPFQRSMQPPLSHAGKE